MCFLKWIEHRHGLPRWHVACTQTHKRGTAITHPLISSIAASPSWVTETCSYLTDGPRASSFYWPKLCQSFFTSISVCACRLRAETVVSAMQTNRCGHCTSHMSTYGWRERWWFVENKNQCSVLLFSVVGTVFSMPLDALLFLMDPINHQINRVFKETENVFPSKTDDRLHAWTVLSIVVLLAIWHNATSPSIQSHLFIFKRSLKPFAALSVCLDFCPFWSQHSSTSECV